MSNSPSVQSFSWRLAEAFVVGDQSYTPETFADLDPSSDNQKVITGVGMKIHDNKVSMIELTTKPIGSDGTLGTASTVRYGDTSEDPEMTVAANGDQDVLVGLGIKASSGDVSLLWGHFRTLDAASGLLSEDIDTVKHQTDSDDVPEQDWAINQVQVTDDQVGVGIVTGIGANYSNSGKGHKIASIAFQTSRLEATVSNSPTGAGSQLSEESPFQQYLDLALIASDAYRTILTKDEQPFRPHIYTYKTKLCICMCAFYRLHVTLVTGRQTRGKSRMKRVT
ncbi:MAG: hypothetical protein AAF585_20985 [Verrucomicrobiota bacterium]